VLKSLLEPHVRLWEALPRTLAGASVPSAISHSGPGNGSAPAGAAPSLVGGGKHSSVTPGISRSGICSSLPSP